MPGDWAVRRPRAGARRVGVRVRQRRLPRHRRHRRGRARAAPRRAGLRTPARAVAPRSTAASAGRPACSRATAAGARSTPTTPASWPTSCRSATSARSSTRRRPTSPPTWSRCSPPRAAPAPRAAGAASPGCCATRSRTARGSAAGAPTTSTAPARCVPALVAAGVDAGDAASAGPCAGWTRTRTPTAAGARTCAPTPTRPGSAAARRPRRRPRGRCSRCSPPASDDPAVRARRRRGWSSTSAPTAAGTRTQFTGTGFPGDFYINYHLYRLVFPVTRARPVRAPWTSVTGAPGRRAGHLRRRCGVERARRVAAAPHRRPCCGPAWGPRAVAARAAACRRARRPAGPGGRRRRRRSAPACARRPRGRRRGARAGRRRSGRARRAAARRRAAPARACVVAPRPARLRAPWWPDGPPARELAAHRRAGRRHRVGLAGAAPRAPFAVVRAVVDTADAAAAAPRHRRPRRSRALRRCAAPRPALDAWAGAPPAPREVLLAEPALVLRRRRAGHRHRRAGAATGSARRSTSAGRSCTTPTSCATWSDAARCSSTRSTRCRRARAGASPRTASPPRCAREARGARPAGGRRDLPAGHQGAHRGAPVRRPRRHVVPDRPRRPRGGRGHRSARRPADVVVVEDVADGRPGPAARRRHGSRTRCRPRSPSTRPSEIADVLRERFPALAGAPDATTSATPPPTASAPCAAVAARGCDLRARGRLGQLVELASAWSRSPSAEGAPARLVDDAGRRRPAPARRRAPDRRHRRRVRAAAPRRRTSSTASRGLGPVTVDEAGRRTEKTCDSPCPRR